MSLFSREKPFQSAESIPAPAAAQPRLLPASFYVLSESENGGEICLRTGGRVRIDLYQTPSSGYTWHLSPASTALLQLEQENFVPQQTENPCPGGDGGTLSLLLLATAPGTGILQLVQSRTYNGPTEIASAYNLHVTVL